MPPTERRPTPTRSSRLCSPRTTSCGSTQEHGRATRTSAPSCSELAIASVAGRPFVEVVRDEILDPLGMRQTGFVYTSEMDARAAVGYHPRRGPMRLLLPRWVIGEPAGRWVSLERFLLDGAPYGGLVGSLDDAARFLQDAPAGWRTRRRAGPRGRTPLRGCARSRPPGAGSTSGSAGSARRRQRNADPAFVEHLGGGAGFFNMIRIYPSLGVGIAVMGNATKYDIDAVAGMAIAS